MREINLATNGIHFRDGMVKWIKIAFSPCIRILAEEGHTTVHFEKLYTYVKLFHCDDPEAFVSAKNVNVLTQSVRRVDSDGYISRCRLIVAFCL